MTHHGNKALSGETNKGELNSLRFRWEGDGRTKHIAAERDSGRGGGDAHLGFSTQGSFCRQYLQEDLE